MTTVASAAIAGAAAPADERPDIGYADIDHIVVTVGDLDAAVDELGQLGLVAAPPQIDDVNGGSVTGVRHLVFEPATGRTDVANMIVLSQPGPPSPVVVAAAPDIERTQAALAVRGLGAGEVVRVPPRVWIDPTDGTRLAIRASRLGMSDTAPMAVNASHAEVIATYHRPGLWRHRPGIRRLVGVTVQAADPTGVASWLAHDVFSGMRFAEGPTAEIVRTRDCFLRVERHLGLLRPRVTGLIIAVDDIGPFLAGVPAALASRVQNITSGTAEFLPMSMPVTLTFADPHALAPLLG